MYGMHFMSARYVIYALYVYVAVMLLAASCCSHGPCYNETTYCGNITVSSLTRYPSYLMLHSEAHEIITVSICYHGTHLTEGTKVHHTRQFWSNSTLISQSKMETLIRWHKIDSCLAYSGLMKNCVCQLFLKFAYWVMAFWPDYSPMGRFN